MWKNLVLLRPFFYIYDFVFDFFLSFSSVGEHLWRSRLTPAAGLLRCLSLEVVGAVRRSVPMVVSMTVRPGCSSLNK
jgi:hypothetical protein